MFAPVSGSAETSTDLPFGAVILTDTNSSGAVTVDADTEEIQADFTATVDLHGAGRFDV